MVQLVPAAGRLRGQHAVWRFAAFVTLTIGCSGGDAVQPDVAPVVSVSAANGVGSISSGSTTQLSASITDRKGKPTSGATFVWATDNARIATVSASGLVTGIGAGTAAISATSSGTTGAFTVTVTPGAAAKLVVATQPGGAASGAPMTTQPVVEVRDLADNVVTGATSQVEVVLVGPTAQLSGTTLVRAVNGVARFTDLVLSGPIGNRALQFVATGLSSTTSGEFSLQAGAASTVALVGALTPLRSGLPVTTPIVTQLRDRDGNDVPLSGRRVVATVSGGNSVTTIANAVANTDAQGRATFAALTVSGVAGSRLLTFRADTTSAPATAVVGLRGGRPTRLTIERDVPLLAEQGAALSPVPLVRLVDSVGNAAPEGGVAVRASLVGSTGSVANGIATTDTTGRATFTGLTVQGATGVVSVQFAATGVISTVSRALTVAPPDTAAQPAFLTTSVSSADTSERVLVLSGPTASATPYLQARNAANAPMGTGGVRWTSRDPSRATVAPDGRITGVAEGRTFIVAQGSRTPSVADSLLVFVPRNSTGPVLRVQLPKFRITTDTFSIIVQVESRDGRAFAAADIEVAWPGDNSFPFTPFIVTSITPLRPGVVVNQPAFQENASVTWVSTTPVSGTLTLVRLNCRVNERDAANQLVLTMRKLIGADLTDLTALVNIFNPVVIIK